jgi:hypothetical protein
MAVTTGTIAVKDGTGASQSGAVLIDPAGVYRGVVSQDEAGAAVYRASASFTPFGTGDRTLISIKGSATKTVRVRKIIVGGTATAAGSTLYALSRTTALGSGGTAVNPTVAKVDSGTVAAGTAVVAHYTTAAQTLGSGPITLWTGTIGLSIVTVPTTGPVTQYPVFPEFAIPGQALVLRGTGDFLEFGNVAGNITAGAILQYTIEWQEDAS